MKKRILSIAFMAVLAFLLSACGDNGNALQGGTTTPTGNRPPANLAAEPAEMFTFEFVESGRIGIQRFGFSVNDHFELETSGFVLTRYHGDLTQVRIPDTIEGFPVVGIASRTFQLGTTTHVFVPDTLEFFVMGWRFGDYVPTHLIIPYGVTHLIGSPAGAVERIQSIDIPPTVTYIGVLALTNLSNLTSITIPDSVTTIGRSAFYRSEQIFRIDISDTNNLTNVSREVFLRTAWYAAQPPGVVYLGTVALGYKGGSNDSHITIREGTTAIGHNAFSSRQLTSVSIPDSVTHIGSRAFERNQLTSVSIPDSVIYIGGSAFSSNQLTSVTIGNSVTYIGGSAFSGNQLTSVTIGNSVTYIGMAAFSNNQLTSVTIGNSVTHIGRNAFRNNQLTSVVIPNSVTHIGEAAFYSNQLTSVTIGNNVISLVANAFSGNPQLDEPSRQRILAINPNAQF